MSGSTWLVTILSAAWLLQTAQCQDDPVTIYIIPPGANCSEEIPFLEEEPSIYCLTLQQYISTPQNFSSDQLILFKLQAGIHSLNGTERLIVSNTNFTMVAEEEAVLDCSESDVQHSIEFSDNGLVEINSTNVIDCQFYFSDIGRITVDGGYLRGVDTINPAITVNGSGAVTVRRWNCSNYDGGCLSLARSSLFLSNSSFTNNSNTITVIETSPVHIYTCFFSDNRGTDGGVINALETDVFINCSTFNNNVATGNGGVIYVVRSDLNIFSSTFSNNSAGKNGGVLFAISANANMYTSTLMNNSAVLTGGVGYIRQGSAFISETNFQSNSAANQSNFFAICEANLKIEDYNLQGDEDPNDSTCWLYDASINHYRNYCSDVGSVGANSSLIIGVSVAVVCLIIIFVVLGVVISLVYHKLGAIPTGGRSIETSTERVYESIPDGIWYPPPIITAIDLDADKIKTRPNKLYGMQLDVVEGEDDMSYCEAYQENGEELSYCNTYQEHRSVANTI